MFRFPCQCFFYQTVIAEKPVQVSLSDMVSVVLFLYGHLTHLISHNKYLMSQTFISSAERLFTQRNIMRKA